MKLFKKGNMKSTKGFIEKNKNYKNILQNSCLCHSPMCYLGGKFQLLPQILPLFPKQINTFVDLFCGGCNVGINVTAKNIIFNDNLLYLIDLYKSFNTKSTQEIIEHVENRIVEYQLSFTNERGYKKIRQLYNEKRNPLDLFVLAAFSFNHQISFNKSNGFNKSFGKEKSRYNQQMKRDLISFLNKLHNKNVSFCCNNFDKFNFNDLSENDFIYCDPPYLISSVDYNSKWNENQEQKLLSILSDIDKRQIKFALSNVLIHRGKTNNILQKWIIDNNYFVSHLEKNYYLQNFNKYDKVTDEVLITNYQPNL